MSVFEAYYVLSITTNSEVEKEVFKLIYIPMSSARAGMILAKSISAPNGMYALLQSGEELTGALIKRLVEHKIDGIYVEMYGSDDIEPKSVIPSETKRQITSEIHAIYSKLNTQPYISHSAVESTRKIAETIVDCVLDREEYLMNMMEIKDYDNYTYSHCLNVGVFSIMLASEMGIDRNRLDDIAVSALMHDIGKIDIPIAIIGKNGPVTESEFAVIKTHPEKGVERLRKCHNVSREVLYGIQSHHEKMDGSGYPYGYKGVHIPLFGRILAVSDVYDALTSQRSYRKAWLPNEAIEHIIASSGTHFDNDIVQLFTHLVCAYPDGSIVKLSDGSTAVVVKNYSENILRPKVRLLENTPLGQIGTEINLLEDSDAKSLTIKSMLSGDDDDSINIDSIVNQSANKHI